MHVSTIPESAAELLRRVSDICTICDVPFKHLRDAEALRSANDKLQLRERAGKFITCYPSFADLESFLDRLARECKGFEGPYILGDKRWEGPIFLRFGAWDPRNPLDERGLPMLKTPEGRWEPDARGPVFRPPEWAPVTERMKTWLVADPSMSQLPFVIERAIRFTNAGGTFRAILNGESVIVKEARRHAGWDVRSRTATDRLQCEHSALSSMRHICNVPRVRWFGRVWENSYLVLSRMNGKPLDEWFVDKYPLYDSGGSEEYVASVAVILTALVDTIRKLHRAGWAHLDIQPANILYDDVAKRISLLDFENARLVAGPPHTPTMGLPGFYVGAPLDVRAHDWIACRQTLLWLLRPSASSAIDFARHPHDLFNLAVQVVFADAASSIDSIESLNDEILREIDRFSSAESTAPRLHEFLSRRERSLEVPSAEDLIGQFVDGMIDHHPRAATRGQPLLPRHYDGYQTASWNLAFGDSGTLLALRATRLAFDQATPGRLRLEQAVLGRLESQFSANLSLDALPSGLGLGVGGAALVLAGSGIFRPACDIADYVCTLPGERFGRLWDSPTGDLLALLAVARITFCPSDVREKIVQSVARASAALVSDVGVHGPRSPRRGVANRNAPDSFSTGFLFGNVGMAFLLGRLYEVTHDTAWLESAKAFLSEELNTWVDHPTDGLQANDNGRTVPYFGSGSAGLVYALDNGPASLRSEFARQLEGARRATFPRTVTFPGILDGIAGIALSWRSAGATSAPAERFSYMLRAHIAGTCPQLGDIRVTPTDPGIRASFDLARGSAGVVIALLKVG